MFVDGFVVWVIACYCLVLVFMFVIITVLYSIFNFITLGCLLVMGWCGLGFCGCFEVVWARFRCGFGGLVSGVDFGDFSFLGSFVADRG